MQKSIFIGFNFGSTNLKLWAVDLNEYLKTAQVIDRGEIELTKDNSIGNLTEAVRPFIFNNNCFSPDEIGVIGVRSAILKGLLPGVIHIDHTYMNALDQPELIGTKHRTNDCPRVAYPIATELDIPIYTADAISSISQNYWDIARTTGIPGIFREGYAHYLSLRYLIYLIAKRNNIKTNQVNCVLVHGGGGASIAACVGGDIVVTNNPNEWNPFGERAGALPALEGSKWLWDKFKKGSTIEEVQKILLKKCGYVGHTGAENFEQLLDMVRKCDKNATHIFKTMCYQFGCEINQRALEVESAITQKDEFQGVFCTGGMFKAMEFIRGVNVNGSTIDGISKWLETQNRTSVFSDEFSGEYETEALTTQVLRAIKGDIKSQSYIIPNL
ncbi:MAG: hypothetical protein ACNFW9_03795 [Candidatus Kerfeldbacteria bacterium]